MLGTSLILIPLKVVASEVLKSERSGAAAAYLCWYSQNCRSEGRERDAELYHVVAMAPRIWKHSRVSMTLPRQLGWLGETSEASWCIFPLVFPPFFHLSALLPLLWPPRVPNIPPKASLRPVSLVFCPSEKFVSPSSIHQIVQVLPPLPTSLWELTGLF